MRLPRCNELDHSLILVRNCLWLNKKFDNRVIQDLLSFFIPQLESRNNILDWMHCDNQDLSASMLATDFGFDFSVLVPDLSDLGPDFSDLGPDFSGHVARPPVGPLGPRAQGYTLGAQSRCHGPG